MTDTDPDFDARANEWDRLFDERRYKDLIDVAIADKIELSKRYGSKSRQIVDVLGWLHLAIGQVMEDGAKGSPECSFCGKKPPAVKLGAGPNAFICNECVGLFAEVFGNRAKT